MLQERTRIAGRTAEVRTKCGKAVSVADATIWHTDVTCPACDRLVHPKKKILRRRKK
jgi:hypothetical protein